MSLDAKFTDQTNKMIHDFSRVIHVSVSNNNSSNQSWGPYFNYSQK